MTIRDKCAAPALTDHCTDDNLCSECWMQRDVEQNPELYAALADSPD